MRIRGTKIRITPNVKSMGRRPTALGEGHIIQSKTDLGLVTKDGQWIKTKQ